MRPQIRRRAQGHPASQLSPPRTRHTCETCRTLQTNPSTSLAGRRTAGTQRGPVQPSPVQFLTPGPGDIMKRFSSNVTEIASGLLHSNRNTHRGTWGHRSGALLPDSYEGSFPVAPIHSAHKVPVTSRTLASRTGSSPPGSLPSPLPCYRKDQTGTQAGKAAPR